MLSRVANSICWMARYMERTNGMLRLLRTNYIASQNELDNLNWHSVLPRFVRAGGNNVKYSNADHVQEGYRFSAFQSTGSLPSGSTQYLQQILFWT